nr:unnamed protein product [Spirometra erinaceieuropaei]
MSQSKPRSPTTVLRIKTFLSWSCVCFPQDEQNAILPTLARVCLNNKLFHYIVTGARQPRGPKRRYEDTLKNSLKQLHISPEKWEDLVQKRRVWRREVKNGAAIYESNRTAAAKLEREARKSQVPRPLNVKHPSLPTCPRCQRAFARKLAS